MSHPARFVQRRGEGSRTPVFRKQRPVILETEAGSMRARLKGTLYGRLYGHIVVVDTL